MEFEVQTFVVIYGLPLKFSPLNTVHKSSIPTIRDVEIVWYIHVGIQGVSLIQ